MSKPKDEKTRKQAQHQRQALLGIKRVEVALSERERQQLNHLYIARAGAGEPYSADELISVAVPEIGSIICSGVSRVQSIKPE